MARKSDRPQKAARRNMIRDYLKNNDISIKSGEDVNSMMRGMIAVAKKFYPKGTFVVQRCFPLNVENESINIIMVSYVFHPFEKLQGFADECMRVLKDDGVIHMAEPYFTPLIRWIL